MAWKLNGSEQTMTSRTTFITSVSFNPKKHDINMEYYMKMALSDIITIAIALGYNEKRVNKDFKSIITPVIDTHGIESRYYVSWFPAFAEVVDNDEDYLGLSKFITYATLTRYYIKYITSKKFKMHNITNAKFIIYFVFNDIGCYNII